MFFVDSSSSWHIHKRDFCNFHFYLPKSCAIPHLQDRCMLWLYLLDHGRNVFHRSRSGRSLWGKSNGIERGGNAHVVVIQHRTNLWKYYTESQTWGEKLNKNGEEGRTDKEAFKIKIFLNYLSIPYGRSTDYSRAMSILYTIRPGSIDVTAPRYHLYQTRLGCPPSQFFRGKWSRFPWNPHNNHATIPVVTITGKGGGQPQIIGVCGNWYTLKKNTLGTQRHEGLVQIIFLESIGWTSRVN